MATLCFSGHRYYVSSPSDEERLDAALKRAYEDGYRVFISGMATGFDLAAAEAVVRLSRQQSGVKLIAAIPFEGQAAGYSAGDRARYEALLPLSEIHILAGRYSHGCYFRRDDWMVERSSRIICWYDGSSSGTRYTVRRAVTRGCEVVNLFCHTDTLF